MMASECICNTGPGTDGPDETCPQHGREYSWWVGCANAHAERADDLAARLAEAEAKVARVRERLDVIEASVQGDGLGVRLVRPTVLQHVNSLRRALDGPR